MAGLVMPDEPTRAWVNGREFVLVDQPRVDR